MMSHDDAAISPSVSLEQKKESGISSKHAGVTGTRIDKRASSTASDNASASCWKKCGRRITKKVERMHD